ncbi:mitochondrial potassium channel-like [Schistocerca gregaria]|uniref:mitochondrial potassium channel-like n=1 Tax=Schistocerca gregaria TaxID=7010 RepID=UPI00211F2D3B|nr:mitochondrial potassium channel-like [Schistocerca gregaria]
MAVALRRGTIVSELFRIKARRPLVCLYKALSNTQPAISVLTEKQESLLTRKLTDLVKWYEEVTGMDEVRRAQTRVLEAEEKFIVAQERRREANKAVTEIQTQLKDIHAALDSTTRGEDRYVQLITQEHQILKEERKLLTEFQQLEREEREYFSMLSSAVKESHEQERAQAEKTKYWSIIGSIIGTVIGVVGSSVNNRLKMKELRTLITDSVANNNDSVGLRAEILPKYEEELSSVIDKLKTVASLSDAEGIQQLKDTVNKLNDVTRAERHKNVGNTDVITDALNKQTVIIEKKLQEIKSTIPVSHIPTSEFANDKITVVTIEHEQQLQRQQRTTQLLIVGSAILVITVPHLLKYVGLV